MILRVRLDTGGELTVPIQFAHIHRGVLVYKHVGDDFEAGVVDLDRTHSIEFDEEDGDEPDSESAGSDGSGERADLRGVAPDEMPLSRGQARIGFGKPGAQRIQMSRMRCVGGRYQAGHGSGGAEFS